MCEIENCPAKRHDDWQGYKKGCLSEKARRDHRMYQYQRATGVRRIVTDLTGVERRLRALRANGASSNEIADEFGISKRCVFDIIRGRRKSITVRTYLKIIRRYPASAEINRGVGAAAKRGRGEGTHFRWAAPLRWTPETIDDPDAEPDWRPLDTIRAERARAARRDVDEIKIERLMRGEISMREATDAESELACTRMLDQGLTIYQITTKLGSSTATVVMTLARAGVDVAAVRERERIAQERKAADEATWRALRYWKPQPRELTA